MNLRYNETISRANIFYMILENKQILLLCNRMRWNEMEGGWGKSNNKQLAELPAWLTASLQYWELKRDGEQNVNFCGN